MGAKELKIWSIVWTIIAALAAVAVFLGNPHHILTFIVAAVLAALTGRKPDDDQLTAN